MCGCFGGGGKLWTKSRSEGDSGAEKEKKKKKNRKKRDKQNGKSQYHQRSPKISFHSSSFFFLGFSSFSFCSFFLAREVVGVGVVVFVVRGIFPWNWVELDFVQVYKRTITPTTS